MILRLRVFLFVLVLVIFGINVMMSWKPLFLSVWIYWDRIIKNNFTWGNVWDPFSYCFRYFFNYSRGWFDFVIYTGILSGFLYGRYVPVSKFISTSRKLTILRLVCIVMFKPHSLNSLIMAFLFLSMSGPDRFLLPSHRLYINLQGLSQEYYLINSIYKILQFHKLLPRCNITLAHQNLRLFPFLPIALCR